MNVQFPDVIFQIAETVEEQGGRALLVGGIVRDILLNLPPKDFDFEVYGISPDRLEAILGSLEPDWMDIVGRAFGVLKVRFEDLDIDVSIPRRESKVGAGHKGFEVAGDPTMSPEEAARRRDFTINALAMDPISGEILDFFGGQKDLANGILRATDPERFRDDPLRVLRAMQFAGRFSFAVEPATLAICREMVRQPEFAALPSARIGEEWYKLLLKSPRPSVGLQIGLSTGAFKILHLELAALVGVPQDPEWHPEGDVWTHTTMTVDAAADIVRREGLKEDDALVIMLGALCHDFGKASTTAFVEGRWRSRGHEEAGVTPTCLFLARMEFGKEIEARVAPLVADHLFPAHTAGEAGEVAIRRLARRLHPATVRELVWVSEADHRGRDVSWDGFPTGDELLRRAEAMDIVSAQPQRLLQGRDLIRLGWVPYTGRSQDGIKFQPILDAVFEAQIKGNITTLEEALEMAKSLVEN